MKPKTAVAILMIGFACAFVLNACDSIFKPEPKKKAGILIAPQVYSVISKLKESSLSKKRNGRQFYLSSKGFVQTVSCYNCGYTHTINSEEIIYTFELILYSAEAANENRLRITIQEPDQPPVIVALCLSQGQYLCIGKIGNDRRITFYINTPYYSEYTINPQNVVYYTKKLKQALAAFDKYHFQTEY